jgi:hypothetical protein
VSAPTAEGPPYLNPETGELQDAPYVPREPGDVEAGLRHDLAEARVQLQDATQLLLKTQREVNRLKNELDEQTAQADEMPQVKIIYKSWITATGRNPKRTKLGPKRTKAILARIREGRDFDLCVRVATVGALAANSSNRDRERMAALAAIRKAVELLDEKDADIVRAAYKTVLGKDVEKYDDLELLFRDEVSFERAMKNADRLDPDGSMVLLDVDG